jgi:POT family proton-dependent oligopeptide transporter
MRPEVANASTVVGPLAESGNLPPGRGFAYSSRTMSKLKGFSRTFWIANVLELFERFAYYGAKAILAVYIAEKVGLGPERSTFLVGSVFNTLLYFLPALAGTVVDRYGFKRSLLLCFSIFCVGYFLIGLAGLPAGKPLVDAFGATPYTIFALVITAIGGSLIKPSIVGTVARTTTEETKSLGYSIYYTLVNIGGAIGPILALQVRQNLGIAYVLVVSSITSLALVVGTLVFFREPPRPADAPPPRSMGQVLRDMLMVFGNARFIGFLAIFSGFWIMFWQIFYSLPFYVRDVLHFEKFEIIETVDAWTIILITIPITALAKKLRPLTAMTLGFSLASASWFLMGSVPTIACTVAAIVIYALGEGLQAPRYYEYVADLAPPAQVGTYMGFAFLPVAIGTFVAGAIAGPLVARYVGRRENDVFVPGPEFAHAPRMWFWVGAIGVVATAGMLLYDRLVARRSAA